MKRDIIILIALCILLVATIGSASAWLFGGSDDTSTGEKINAVHNDSTFYFYSIGSLASDDGYEYAVVVDGTPYYLSDSLATKLHDSNISKSFSKFYDLEIMYDYSDSPISYAGFVGAYPFVVFKMDDSSTQHLGDSEFECDADFSFEYKVGEVGVNNEAHIITKLFKSDGTEL